LQRPQCIWRGINEKLDTRICRKSILKTHFKSDGEYINPVTSWPFGATMKVEN
jgi:hypothetical protein